MHSIPKHGLRNLQSPNEFQMRKLEFLFDFSSPNCYVALAKLQQMKKSVEVSFTPIFLGGLFKMTDDAPIPVGTLEFNYMEANLVRLSRLLDIPFRFPRDRFPVNSLRALRGFYFARTSRMEAPYLEKIFRACWSEDRDISSSSVLNELTTELGFDPTQFAQSVEQNDMKLKLREDTQRAFDRGVFGAPTFFIDGQMYWGSPEVLWFLEKESFT